MGIRGLDHVQLAMPAGGEAEAVDFYERLYVDDPFGNRIELMEPSNAAHG